ncbi:uncharacterized protein [Linepithema humile]|uniref:uncharacterized protein n=1 Tax=Linepithema humile TaxID=83485 RepID=UPI000623934D|nr:PREDICTED: uncharacterized protein LOC105668777 [Linepithema humile]
MNFGISLWIKSLLACWAILAVALVYSAVGYFISHTLCASLNHTKTTKQGNVTSKYDVNQQELGPSLLRNNETMDTSYCIFEQCKIITCSYIPEKLDSGKVIKTFIENTFKVKCGSNVAVKIKFTKSAFPGNKLRKKWLQTDLAINELTFDNCFLTNLNKKAFSSTIFHRTTRLFLINNNISILKRATFRYLPNLKDFWIIDNKIKWVDRNLLKDVGNTLETLQIENAIENTEVLRNITGEYPLPAVQILSLRYNRIPIIDSQLFSGVFNLVSLYLSKSYIETVCPNTFAPISRSVKQIFMNDNFLTSLPKGLFDTIIQWNIDFGLTINNNLWHCDCKLKWMQDMMREHSNVIKKDLICSSPEVNANKSFTLANFCNETTTMIINITDKTTTMMTNKTDETTTMMINITNDTTHNDVISTTISVSNPSSTIESSTRETIHVDCDNLNYSIRSQYSHHVFSTVDLEILGFQNFFATDYNNGSVLLTLPDLYVSLIWFNNDVRSNSASLKKSINCVTKVKCAYLINLEVGTSYTICLLNNLTFTPLNCWGLTTRSLTSSIDKNIIIIIFVISLILTCFVSALIMFFTVRRNPAMLKGNKRIMIVKRRTLDAIVLPEGLSSDTIESEKKNAISTISQSLKEDVYAVPFSPARNSIHKNSRNSSVQSDPSYISVRPIYSQLNSWNWKQILHMNSATDPPSLPPPRMTMSCNNYRQHRTRMRMSMTI